MRVLPSILVPLLAVMAMACVAQAAPLEAYGRLPAIEEALLSPDGKSLAMVVTNGEDRIVAVQDIASGEVRIRARAGSVKVRGLYWAGDQHLLVLSTITAPLDDVLITRGNVARRESITALSLDLETKRSTPLLNGSSRAMNVLTSNPSVRMVEGKPTVFVEGIAFDDGGVGRISVIRIDLARTENTLVEIGGPGTREWVIGPDGTVLAQEVYEPKTGRWAIKIKQGKTWREAVTDTALQDGPYLVGLGRDANTILYASRGADGVWARREVKLDGSKPADPMPLPDAQGDIRERQDGRLIGQTERVGDEMRRTFFNPTDARIWASIAKAFKGSRLELMIWSLDRSRVVVRVDSPTEGPAFALVDLKTMASTWLGEEYPKLQAADIGSVRPISFKARDGLALSGYLTLPNGRETAKGLPLIVAPHGGPEQRDLPGFDWWTQAMASRGYAVLQVNFRGSGGLGDEFRNAGYGEWGRKMQTDLADGVAFLAGEGTIDPKRTCIVGASYGGYAALAGATLDQGVYRCAVGVAGVADLQRQVAYSKSQGGIARQRYWLRFMGAQDGNDPVLARYSPAKLADKVTIPIMLIHGKDDTVVPLEQSQIMADALRKAGKPVEMVVMKGEDHWLSRGETRLQMLTAAMAFVEKHNPPN